MATYSRRNRRLVCDVERFDGPENRVLSGLLGSCDEPDMPAKCMT
jgi:hypothetical protein